MNDKTELDLEEVKNWRGHGPKSDEVERLMEQLRERLEAEVDWHFDHYEKLKKENAKLLKEINLHKKTTHPSP